MKYIYCFTNLINGKKYIGSTISTPGHRLQQHLYNAREHNEKSDYPLYQAIRKYGIENFNFEVLESKDCSEEEIREIEHQYILKYDCISPNGYNQTDDTKHPLMTPEIIAKVSNTKRENAKRVGVFKDDKLIEIYRSATDCAEALNIDAKKISACCRGERAKVDDLCFHWMNDDDTPNIVTYTRSYKGEAGTTQIQSRSKKVAKIDLQTGEILDIYDTIALAARENNCDSSGISKVCRGLRN